MASAPATKPVTITLNIIGDCSIEWDGGGLTSASSRLFGLVLLLTLDAAKPRSRRMIESMLFEEEMPEAEVAHNLRQLLYRLRRSGLSVIDAEGVLRLADARVVDSMERLQTLTCAERAELPAHKLAVFPGWNPKLPSAFLDWLDKKRLRFESGVKHLTATDLAYASKSGDWVSAERSARRLGDMGVACEEWRIAHAEALYMLGRQAESVESLDMLLSESLREDDASAARALRARALRPLTSSAPAPLRGREVAIAQLNEQWQEAQGGTARLMSIIGPPGIGKTRLSDEFASVVRMRGGTVMSYCCDPAARPYPLALFAHLLPELRNLRGSIGVSERHLAVLERLRQSGSATNESALEHFSPARIRAELHDALVDLIEAVSEDSPLLLIVDDAHLLDNDSAALIRALVATPSTARALVLACCRAQETTLELTLPNSRVSALTLTALSEADSRSLFRDLTRHEKWNSGDFDCRVEQAAGNPFFLHALSRKDKMSSAPASTSLDIASLAAGAYYSLNSDSRTFLEAILILGPQITLDRALRLSGIEDQGAVRVLRALEERGLCSMQGRTFRGPHALLAQAIMAIVPASVKVLLTRRMAEQLSAELDTNPSDVGLALSAADAWLASGELLSSLALIESCARRIAAIGQPDFAAELLSTFTDRDLPPLAKARALELVVTFANAGSRGDLATSSLLRIRDLAPVLSLGTAELTDLELRIAESTHARAPNFKDSQSTFAPFARRGPSFAATRHRAAMNLLISADATFDASGAARIVAELEPLSSASADSLLGAYIVYHTTFGNIDRAYDIAHTLLRRNPEPTLDQDAAQMRRHAAYCYCRLQRMDEAREAATEDFTFLSQNGDRRYAMNSASLLADIAISLGDFDGARAWHNRTLQQLGELNPYVLAPHSGYVTTSAQLALLAGDYAMAEEILTRSACSEYVTTSARNRALVIALELRLQLMRGDNEFTQGPVTQLRHLYSRGKTYGGFDTVAEMLWCVERTEKGDVAATRFLATYLNKHRRELERPEWQLRKTTADDASWLNSQWAGASPSD
jgi:tetratricopeptide (TPR) repeat protein